MGLALAAAAVGLLLAFATKEPCVTHSWVNFFQYRHLCYNDIQPLFYLRGVSRGQVPYKDVFVEYPVLIGSFMYVAGRLLALLVHVGLVRTYADPAYFVVTALLLAPFSVAVTLLARPRVTAGRLMLWTLGTPALIYSFLNWDLLGAAGLTWGIVQAERRRWGWAGIALGLGASAKLYPAFALPCVGLVVLSERDWKGARRLTAGFLGAAAAANVPWMIAAFGRWMRIWTWQAGRYPDYGTAWYWLGRMAERYHPSPFWNTNVGGYGTFLGVAGLIAFGLTSITVLWIGWRRRGPQGYPAAAATLAIIASFMVISKVNSPQYALWILPLLVLVDIPWAEILAYFACDLVLFVSGFYWFTELGVPVAPGWERLFELSVFARAICLVLIALTAMLRGRRAFPVGYTPGGRDLPVEPVRPPSEQPAPA